MLRPKKTSDVVQLVGTELVGLSAAETMNPTKNIPRAVRQVFWRIATVSRCSLTKIGSTAISS